MLVLVTQASAAAKDVSGPAAPDGKQEQRASTLEEQLERKLTAARKYRGTIRFYEKRPWLLTTGGKSRIEKAKAALARAERRLAQVRKAIAALRKKIRRLEVKRLSALPPRVAICGVFGEYCEEAVAVAWCESRLDPTARNGQYLGLFQMGSYARETFGHGPSPHEQAIAAHKYFVESGRDWSPWSCRWAAY